MKGNAQPSRAALVTGGSRGIGRAIVESLSQSGWSVGFTYAGSHQAAQQLSQELEAQGSPCKAYRADARDFQRAQELAEECEAELGPISLLVNNAGIKRDKPLFSMALEDWQAVIDTNLSGTFNYARSFVPRMMKRRCGTIVNIVSVSGIAGLPGQTNYSASKAGVIGFTKALAKETARFGLRVNAVAPGLIETDMTADLSEKALKRILAQIPAGKLGKPADVARLVEFLAEPSSSYLTGQVIPVDGGMI